MASTEKEIIALGRGREDWGQYEERLLQSIKSLFMNHLPYSYPRTRIMELFKEKYEVVGGRSLTAIEDRWDRIIKPIWPVDKHEKKLSINDTTFYIIREWYSPDFNNVDITIGGFESKYVFCSGPQIKTRSVIAIDKTKNNGVLYVYPTVLDADYAQIFMDAFCVKDKNNPQKVKEDREPGRLYSILTKQQIKIPLHNKSDKPHILDTAVFFLLDFLFAQMACQIVELNEQSSRNDNKRFKQSIANLLDKLKDIGYINSQHSRLTQIINDAIKMNKQLSKIDYSTLSAIIESYNQDTGDISIPAYWISMPRVFELYVFSQAKKDLKDQKLRYKETLGGIKLEPDISLKENHALKEDDALFVGKDVIIDAKYKYQYVVNIDDIPHKDMDRMTQYLLFKEDMKNQNSKEKEAKKKHKEETKDWPIGILVFPSIREDSGGFENVLRSKEEECVVVRKLYLPLPVKPQSKFCKISK